MVVPLVGTTFTEAVETEDQELRGIGIQFSTYFDPLESVFEQF